eukprot:6173263-Pleurochrysis_carterae.AAC.4
MLSVQESMSVEQRCLRAQKRVRCTGPHSRVPCYVRSRLACRRLARAAVPLLFHYYIERCGRARRNDCCPPWTDERCRCAEQYPRKRGKSARPIDKAESCHQAFARAACGAELEPAAQNSQFQRRSVAVDADKLVSAQRLSGANYIWTTNCMKKSLKAYSA